MRAKNAGLPIAVFAGAMSLVMVQSAHAVFCRIEFPADPASPGVSYYYENSFSILDNRLVPDGEAAITAMVRPARTMDDPGWVEKREPVAGIRRRPSYKLPSLRLHYASGNQLDYVLAVDGFYKWHNTGYPHAVPVNIVMTASDGRDSLIAKRTYEGTTGLVLGLCCGILKIDPALRERINAPFSVHLADGKGEAISRVDYVLNEGQIAKRVAELRKKGDAYFGDGLFPIYPVVQYEREDRPCVETADPGYADYP